MTSLNIVFAATPEFALPCLDAIKASHHKLKAIYTQPDRPAGRGRQIQASAVKSWAQELHLPVYQPLNFKDSKSVQTLADLNPDVMVVIAYGLILPQSVLDIPKLGCINVHASLLPHWRGASPIQQAILHGDAETGVTIMQMDAGMDTGDILATVSCPVDAKETAGSLHDKLAQLAASPLLSTLDKLAAGDIEAEPQNHKHATYAPKIRKQDAYINWSESATCIERKIRAFNPWPIAFTYADKTLLRVHQARVVSSTTTKAPGTIMVMNQAGIQVATGKQILSIERLQFPGGKILSVRDWLNSKRNQLQENMILQ